MPLIIKLKPHEKILLGNTVISNNSKSTSFTIENSTVVLREKDIMTEKTANTPAKRIYHIVQSMYMMDSFEASIDLHNIFLELSNDFISACPNEEIISLVTDIGINVLNNRAFKALKLSRALIEYEDKIL